MRRLWIVPEKVRGWLTMFFLMLWLPGILFLNLTEYCRDRRRSALSGEDK